MNEIKYTLTRETLTLIHDGRTHSVQKDAPNFRPLREALLAEQWDEVPKHLTVGKSLEEWAKGEFKVENGVIRYKEEAIPRDLNNRILGMAQEGSDPTPLFRFWERLQKNPSMRSVEQLWSFLRHTNIPLTTNGTFYAYKGVKSNYRDAHSGTIDNSPGAVNRMSRNKISDDPRVACHFGFHVGALDYARGFSEQVVICEVDPEHVVCVPYDHSAQKMRVCEYKVVGNYSGVPLPSTIVIPDTEVEEFVETDKDDFEDQQDAPKPEEEEDEDLGDPDDGDDGEDDGDDTFGDLNDDDEDDEEDPPVEDEAETDDIEVPDEPPEVEPKNFFLNEQHELPPKTKEELKKEKEARRKASMKREVDPDKRAAKKGFQTFAAMNMADLMKQSIEDLRQYAGKGLGIVGASKIPGGKAELVKRILKVRKRASK